MEVLHKWLQRYSDDEHALLHGLAIGMMLSGILAFMLLMFVTEAKYGR
jgi:hypothetical protein